MKNTNSLIYWIYESKKAFKKLSKSKTGSIERSEAFKTYNRANRMVESFI